MHDRYGMRPDGDIVWRNNPPSDPVDFEVWRAQQAGLTDNELFGLYEDESENLSDRDKSYIILGWVGIGIIAVCLTGIVWAVLG
jgi:hypothetical protein